MFYTYRQNNSGGSFDTSSGLARFVIIEAKDHDEANARAVDIGIYFDGCDNEIDCDCCGDRWSRAWADDGTVIPETYGMPALVVETKDYDGFVHFLDGSVKTFTEAEI